MSTLRFRASGPLAALPAALRRALIARDATAVVSPDGEAGGPRDGAGDGPAAVGRIIARVRAEGDAALRDFAREFDGVSLDALEVPRAEWDAALATLDPALRRAMERSARNIRAVHEAFAPVSRECTTPDGVRIARHPEPLERVGVYAPGGRASYPSSLLMGAIPARVAGVKEVVVCSPPDGDGRPSSVLLAAAALAGVDRVFAVGGAGAVAAMAFGTESIPAVDRIVGPGNAYVAEAKLQVSSVVGIDSPAGPSELLILADDSASPAVLVREILAQAEHDPDVAVVLVTDAPGVADAVRLALTDAIAIEPRAAVIRTALARRGALLTTSSLAEAAAFSNEWAPEHLLLTVRPEAESSMLEALRNAGTIFVGSSASVAFGDYLSGANHVLPTGGAARRYSGLSTSDFVRWTTTQWIDRRTAASLARDTETFARAEGLPAHASAAAQWAEA